MLKKLILLILFASALTLAIKSDNSGGKVFPYNYQSETLPNGLKVIIIPSPTKGIVAYYSVVRTGSRDEWEPGHTGFAHFFEHMMFRGTKKYPGHVYDSLVISMGANANAYTTDDYTCYHLNITKDNLEKVMELESDRFQNLFYEKPAFQTESQAVYGEYRKGKTSPYFWIWEKMLETAFESHTYKHTTIGFEADIKAMPEMYDYSISFFNRYYRPENVVLLLVGDVNKNEIMPMINKYYGNWQKGYVLPQIKPEPPQKSEKTAKVTYPGKTLPIIGISYKGDTYNPENKNVVAAMLFGDLAFGENSELYKKLYLKEQKIQMLEPEFNKNRDPFLWIVWSMVKAENDVDYVRDEIYKSIDFYANNPIDELKLNNLKKRIKYMFLMNLDTPNKIAGGLARDIAITGGIESMDKFFQTLDSITPNDIKDAVNLYFKPQFRTVVYLTGKN